MKSEADEASLQLPNWGSLPQELISAILVRLPVKYLLQFKCVSKDWLRLISSPHFVKAHLHVSSKDYRVLLCDSDDPELKHCSVTSLFDDRFTNPFYLDYPVEYFSILFGIVGSVNGLICFHNGLTDDLVMWNPSTRKLKKVPAPTDAHRFVYGFGYDEVHDDYKMVGITDSESPVCGSQIYNLRSDSWRELDFQSRVSWCESAKFVNGKLHWVTDDPFGGDRGIISFDLVDEKFGEVVLPSYKERTKNLSLGVLGSDLSMLCGYLRQSPLAITQSDLWVMKEYGVKESWTKLYTIIYPDNATCYVSSPPVCMSCKGESLFVNRSHLSIYNPEDKSFTEVADIYGHLQAQLYIESLVCPFLQNEPTTQH